MSEPHEFSSVDGVKWERCYLSPRVGFSSKIDGSKESFMSATNKKCSVGDLWEASAESSQKREKQYGKDTVKEKFHESYSEMTKGKKILSKFLE